MSAVSKKKRKGSVKRSVSMPEHLWRQMEVRAQADHRSISGYLQMIVAREIEQGALGAAA